MLLRISTIPIQKKKTFTESDGERGFFSPHEWSAVLIRVISLASNITLTSENVYTAIVRAAEPQLEPTLTDEHRADPCGGFMVISVHTFHDCCLNFRR